MVSFELEKLFMLGLMTFGLMALCAWVKVRGKRAPLLELSSWGLLGWFCFWMMTLGPLY